MNNGRISHQQFVCLLAVFNSIATSLYLPGPMAKLAGSDAWLSVPVSMLLGAGPVVLTLGVLVRRHPNQGFGQAAEACLGRWGGRFVTLVLGSFGLFLASLVIRDVVDFAPIALLKGTPMLVTALLFTTTTAYAADAGSEVVARLAVLVFLLAALALPFMTAGLMSESEISRIRPLLANGLGPVLRAAWLSTGWFAESMVLAPFAFQIKRTTKALSACLLGNVLAAGSQTGYVALALVVFSAPLTQKLTYTSYSLAQQVSIGQFLQRLEIGLLTVWLTGMVAKAAATLWSSTICLTWTVGLKPKWWITTVLSAVAMGLTLIWRSHAQFAWFGSYVWTPITLPIVFGLCLLLLGGSFLHKRRHKGVSA